MKQKIVWFLATLFVLVLTSFAFGQVGSTTPNILGGYDYRGSQGSGTTTPNIFGGQDFRFNRRR